MSSFNSGRKPSTFTPREQISSSLSGHTNLYASFIKPTNNFLSQLDVPLLPQQSQRIINLSSQAESGQITSTEAMTRSASGFFKSGFNAFKQGNFSTGLTHIAGGFAEGVGASKIIADHEGSQGKLGFLAQQKYDNDLI